MIFPLHLNVSKIGTGYIFQYSSLRSLTICVFIYRLYKKNIKNYLHVEELDPPYWTRHYGMHVTLLFKMKLCGM